MFRNLITRRTGGLVVALLAAFGLVAAAGVSPAAALVGPANNCINYYIPNSTHVDANVIQRVCATTYRNGAGEPFGINLNNVTTWSPPGGNFTATSVTLIDYPNDSGLWSEYSGSKADGSTWNSQYSVTWTQNTTAKITLDTAAYGPACVYVSYASISITQNAGCPSAG